MLPRNPGFRSRLLLRHDPLETWVSTPCNRTNPYTRPDAILVGFFERRKLSFKLGYFTICEPEVNVLEFVSGGLRGSASNENCAAFVHEVMRSLDEGDADMALWEEVDVQSPLYNYALRWPRFVSRDHFPVIDSHWWLRNFPDSLDEFLLSRSRSQRSKLRHKYNACSESFRGENADPLLSLSGGFGSGYCGDGENRQKSERRVLDAVLFDTPQAREQMAIAAASGLVENLHSLPRRATCCVLERHSLWRRFAG